MFTYIILLFILSMYYSIIYPIHVLSNYLQQDSALGYIIIVILWLKNRVAEVF